MPPGHYGTDSDTPGTGPACHRECKKSSSEGQVLQKQHSTQTHPALPHPQKTPWQHAN